MGTRSPRTRPASCCRWSRPSRTTLSTSTWTGVFVGAATTEGSNDWRLDFDLSSYSLGDHVLRAISYENGEASAPVEITVTIVDGERPEITEIFPAAQTVVSS